MLQWARMVVAQQRPALDIVAERAGLALVDSLARVGCLSLYINDECASHTPFRVGVTFDARFTTKDAFIAMPMPMLVY